MVGGAAMWRTICGALALAVAVTQTSLAGGLGEPVMEPEVVVGEEKTDAEKPGPQVDVQAMRPEPGERPDVCVTPGRGLNGCDGGR